MSNKAEVLSTHTPVLFRAAVSAAVALLKAGEVVALPTETVYGLAANALDPHAVAKIYEIKGRPSHNPIIVHVAGKTMAQACVTQWTEVAENLARSFWPGPLTVVLPRAPAIPDIVTGGGQTVGVRWPSHPFMQEVIRACDFPLAAPSANPSNEISPTTASHVVQRLGHKLSLIIDGGQSQVGIESTVIDLTSSIPRVLRPGIIHQESLRAVLGEDCLAADDEPTPAGSEALRSPGLLRKHYAPQAKVLILEWSSESDLLQQLSQRSIRSDHACVIAHSQIPSGASLAAVCVIPHDPEAYARAIYGELHRCDEEGVKIIIIEKTPDTGAWKAVSDRLARASAS
ncbi:MAG TPA: L-threonylcarbamoyladenylate synthase [Candidatus Saccharimonadales bacterium]|nr:L-threonylcarbamoyladenylate synthase [Candidatus Saccharimonadales bacterium]